jgi:chromosome segregation protein
MQLTKLEIKGFKSFGDKIVIHFNEGVTAIVGPNGCGKSNVVDAIRWVLGEQSTKMLRSDKMENILFNGTKNRKPAHLAEVSLTFDNTKQILPTEFSQVTITRKLYRNGESEYRLNDVKCRLKDITDLFLDTGIGTDTYSIIELKMIDEIINNKDHSRRHLFEEASGIAKYKIRKKQTFSKLKDTQSDLDRVDDLLAEIDKNLKSLENQAKKTTRYYKLKETYKEASIQLAQCKAAHFQQQQLDLQQEKEAKQLEIKKIAEALQQKEETLQQYKNNTLSIEKNLAIQQKATQEYVHKIRSYESEKKIKNERLRHLQQAELRLEQEITQDKQQHNHVLYNLKRIDEEKLEAENQLHQAESQLEKSKALAEELGRQLQKAKLQLEQGLKAEQNLLNQKHQWEKELAVLRIQEEALQQEGLRNLADTASRETELHEFSRAKEALKLRIESLEGETQLWQQQEQALQEELSTTEDLISQLQQEMQRESRMLDAKQNEYNLTKSLVDNLEGFPESIRFLRKHAGWKKPFPLFSDVLFCKEEFRIAIENHLESYMNYYVVDTMDDATHAIQLLSDSSRGRAQFFVLDTLENNPLPKLQDAETPAGFIPVLEVIRVEEKYQKLCQWLLHGVYLMPDRQEHMTDRGCPQTHEIWLHPEGKYAKHRFGISGGSVGLFEGKRIGRAKNLENLAKEIKGTEQLLKRLEQSITEQNNKYQALKGQTQQSKIQAALLELQQLQQSHLTLQTKQEQYEAFIINSQNRKVAIEEKITAILTEIASKEPKFSEIDTTLATLSGDIRAYQEQVSDLAEDAQTRQGIYNQDNIRLHQLKNKVSGLEKDREYRESQASVHSQRLTKNQQELEQTKAQIKEILQHVDLNDEDLLLMYSEKETLEAGLKELQEIYENARHLISETEENLAHMRKQKEMADADWMAWKDKANQLEIEINRMTERLSVEFQLDFDEIQELTQNFDPALEPTYVERVEKLRKQLEEFGTINPMAMEAYEEMMERYTFITKEKQDLLDAKKTLLETISEIDEQARQNFMDAFEKVRTHFIRVFRSLFNEEDSCDLVLTDPEHPLESDIDIIARPKGKRPLSINQLSGGEKTLTSTALLFSLYLLKPAPFCIFDEVDAPLDDTNIDKFNNIIREFSHQSQFIVVSHNKRTIASTDIIYGVTMIEQGVSKVVAVDLRDVA